MKHDETVELDGIAIIGLAVRFPGADSVEQFWANLRAGKESVSFFSDDELRAAGVDPATLAQPGYVKANGVLRDADKFDASFFGISPREAEAMDPQHRVFLELAWEALERAGYDPARTPGRVGVFAGAGLSTYLLKNLAPNRALVDSAGELPLLLGNNKDFVPTRVSYKLDLRGPSVNVNSACSTSLVATHLAGQSLLDYHCDLALAGGVSIQVPQVQGYRHTEGAIGSPDGHCRAFDAQARGTVSGNGAGIVVLKRLAEALADGDTIHAVIRGSAVNNDGADKVGFTAPSISGQSQVIAEALEVAGVSPAEISYVEAHGTGTELGDPIEMAALTQVFGTGHDRAAKCALGSVKTNLGHLDEAAGAAGLAKTVLALAHRELPPSLHFSTPNPKIDFAASAFAVNAQLTPWRTAPGVPRRAGVSSFGLGGTNAHVVLEEAPALRPTTPGRSQQLLVLSAKTERARNDAAQNLARHLELNPDADLADVSFTLAQGRQPFAHRRTIVARDAAEAVRALRAEPSARTSPASDVAPEVVFLFSGQGSQYPRMLAGLYATEPVIRREIDRGAEWLRPHLGFNLRELLASSDAAAAARLRQTAVAQPVLFLADYALAQLWRSWGIEPAALVGHSLGEYVAACVAGVFSFEDALGLVAARGALMQAQPPGGMLAVGLGEEPAAAVAAAHGLVIAAVNAGNACVLSGPLAAIEETARELAARDIAATRLETSHAFHSPMMEPVLAPLAAKVRAVERHAPRIPVASNVTGRWLTAEEARDPEYWARQVRAPVRFADNVTLVRERPGRILLEVGPGRALASMAQRVAKDTRVLTSLRTAAQSVDDLAHLLTTAGRLWEAGVEMDWTKFFAGQVRRRVVLPTYPFQRQRYWIEPPKPATSTPRDTVVTAEAAPASEPTHAMLASGLSELLAAETRAASRADCVEAPTYASFARALETWCGEVLYHYVTAGRTIAAGERESAAALRQRHRVLPAFTKAFDSFLHALAADGYLRHEGDDVVWLRASATVPSVARGREALLARFAEFRGIVRLVDHCTAHYAAALSGEIQAITVLYPDGSSELLESTARDAVRHTNKDVYIETLKAAIDQRLAAAGGRRVRILEVGVGDGLLAGRIAPGLQGRNVEYVATDLSRAFVAKAERAAVAAGLDFVRFGVLDISCDPVAQGFAAGAFDLVICLDVVHATPRLAETLGHLRTLLAPGGWLGVIEKVRAERWVDLVWGLAEGWWYFADADLRQHGPLLPAERWEALLRRGGFADVAVLPQTAQARATSDYALLLAEAPRAPRAAGADPAGQTRAAELSKWFYAPGWKPVPAPAPEEAHRGARVLVLLDDGGLGQALAEWLQRNGAVVTTAPAAAVRTIENWRVLLAGLGGAPTRIVHLGAATRDERTVRAKQFVHDLAQLAGALVGGTDPCTLTLVTRRGCAVQADEAVHPTKALLVGPLRVIPLECPHVAVRLVDVDTGDAPALDALTSEVESEPRAALVAWRNGQRWIETLERRPLAEAVGANQGLRERGVYLITGGFGSMGRAFARELAQSVRARLVLVGRHVDGEQQRRVLAEIVAAGGEAIAVQADVSNAVQVAHAVKTAREHFGAVHGVFHTAGVYDQGVMWERSPSAIDATLAPKVDGTLALSEALAGERLDLFVVCSSLASLRPVAGQVDYAAANAFLDAWAGEHARRTRTRTISIAWGMWQELGMMEHASIAPAQQQAVRDEIAREGWAQAGIAAWRRVLAHAPSGVVIVSPQPLRAPGWLGHPLLRERCDEQGRTDYVAHLDPRRHWVADEHRLDGRAVLPGTAYLELAHAAFVEHTGATAVELSEVYFLSPLVLERDEPREVRVVLHGDTFVVISRIGPDEWIEHARGEVRIATGAAAEAVARAEPLTACPVPDDAVRFGPRWRNLQELAFGERSGTATLALASEFANDVGGYRLHPALLDMATGFITLRHPLPDSLPFGYRRVIVRGPLPARLRSHVRVVDRGETTLELAATLTDEAGQTRVEIEGYQLRRTAVARAEPAADNVRLAIGGGQGLAESLQLVRAARRAPAAEEIEIQVEAAGLNFIEVLYALGLLPVAPELEEAFGLECAGRIVRVGSGVSGWAPGDEVIGYANGCFAQYVAAPVRAIARRPAGVSAVEAATLPAAFATAHHALVTQGRLARGERVLIHAAAGGVGQAAVQIARHVGAEIFATAGSPAKRAALRAMGVEHVMDSRTLAFADDVRAATGGRGVDVVLNSLGGEFLRASLELVAPHGRFLELGKRDLLRGGALELKPFARIISFIVIDVGPDLPGFPALWREVAEHFERGIYRPLPVTAFRLSEPQHAFEFMAAAKHIGKIVLTVDAPEMRARAMSQRRPSRGRSLAAILGVSESAAEMPPPTAVVVEPSRGHERPELATAYVEPADETERKIAAVWSELLGVARVGTQDNFFELHGDSLLAAQVVARLHVAVGVKLPLSALFDAPTVAGLATRVRGSAAAPQVTRTAGKPLVGAQEEGEI
ncbi:type I polyketide synthase [Opitutus terrae]|uniref:Beta-ketoacyl synthase n=1 Tax=Opitutus terrae (strain DSM 11246 / JCM 15787 / PB90-1) TaxID=452637 RepID=B1ZYL6_OPITP|nr:type I polyketide synthase [Opitutus terrae]ACB75252.1 Beta-ketoacyl synthase [Opitutus terrae PB90-1]